MNFFENALHFNQTAHELGYFFSGVEEFAH